MSPVRNVATLETGHARTLTVEAAKGRVFLKVSEGFGGPLISSYLPRETAEALVAALTEALDETRPPLEVGQLVRVVDEDRFVPGLFVEAGDFDDCRVVKVEDLSADPGTLARADGGRKIGATVKVVDFGEGPWVMRRENLVEVGTLSAHEAEIAERRGWIEVED